MTFLLWLFGLECDTGPTPTTQSLFTELVEQAAARFGVCVDTVMWWIFIELSMED